MRTSVRRTLCATAIAGGFTVLGIAFAASSATAADTPGSTSGANGLVSGNQTGGSTEASGGTSGNQVTLIGSGNTSDSDQTGGGSTAGSGGDTTNGQDGEGSGNQTSPAFTFPIDTSENQFTVIGDGNDNTGSEGGNGTPTTPEQAGTETGQPDEGETQGGSGMVVEPGSAGPGNAGSGSNTSTDGRSALAGILAAGAALTQAGPAAVIAGVLPATGSSAALLLWAILALALLLLGMFMVGGQRRGRNEHRPLRKVAMAI